MEEPQARLAELNRLLSELTPQDTFIQGEFVAQLYKCWGLLSEVQRLNYLTRGASLIPRCQEASNPHNLLLTILKLPTEEDVRRALTAGVGISRKKRGTAGREELLDEPDHDYLWTPQEEIYREVTGWLRKYLHYAKGNYVPLGFHFWSAICLLGAVCKRQVYFDAGQFFVLANWYVLLVGDSATGKSAAARIAVELIERLNRQICSSTNETERLPHGREFVNCLPNDVTKARIVHKLSALRYCPNPHPHSILKPDGSTLALNKAPDEPVDATAFIFIDELATLFGKDVFKVSDLIGFFTQIKESDRYEKGTQHEGDKFLFNLAVSMIACCAPAWLRGTISPTILGGGFADRTTYVFREPVWDRMLASSPHKLKPRDPITGEQLASDLRSIAELDTKKVPELTPEAQVLGDKLYEQLVSEMRVRYYDTGTADDITSASRAYNDVLRLSLLLAVSDTIGTPRWPKVVITNKHLDLAQRIMKMEEYSMRRFIERSQEAPADPLEIKLFSKIIELEDCISRTDLHKLMKGYKVHQIIPAAKQLIEEGRLQVVQIGSGQRWRQPGHECKVCLNGVEVLAEKLKF